MANSLAPWTFWFYKRRAELKGEFLGHVSARKVKLEKFQAKTKDTVKTIFQLWTDFKIQIRQQNFEKKSST